MYKYMITRITESKRIPKSSIATRKVRGLAAMGTRLISIPSFLFSVRVSENVAVGCHSAFGRSDTMMGVACLRLWQSECSVSVVGVSDIPRAMYRGTKTHTEKCWHRAQRRFFLTEENSEVLFIRSIVK